MHKISVDAAKAFGKGLKFSRQNTENRIDHNGESNLYLHGNKIAWTSNNLRTLHITQSGWDTPTTNDRLRALGIQIEHRRRQLYINGKIATSSDVITITEW